MSVQFFVFLFILDFLATEKFEEGRWKQGDLILYKILIRNGGIEAQNTKYSRQIST